MHTNRPFTTLKAAIAIVVFSVLGWPNAQAQLGCPTPEPINGCAGQEEIDQAFQNWANTFPGGSSGNCAPVITYQVNGTGQYSQSELAAVVAGVTPDACTGGFVEIVCTSVDPCQPSNPPEICVSVYEVFPATPLPLLCPPVQVLEACDGQAAINAAFIGWATSFGGQGSMTGLCVPVVTYSVNGSGTFSQSELVDLLLSEPPNACDGAAIVVECTGVDGCGGVQTCFSEFFVIPPPDIVAPDCPGSVFVEGCDGQAAINIAFAGWLNGFGGSATGGCNPVVTYSVNGSGSFTQSELFDVVGPPDACAGGTIDITCTVQDACGSTSSCSSTFFVNPAEVTGASCPPSQIVDGDAGQAQVDFAFANWASSFATNASGGCNPVITYSVNGSGSFSPAQLLQVLVPPNACTGGVVDVECTITDICGTATCQSFFEVLPTSPLEIECPPSDVIECADQATINAAFLNWANSFGSNVTGSTSPVIIYSVNGSGSFTQSELVDVIASSIPQACSGGTITVVCTATNGCETATCTSSLTVLPPPTLTDPGCPPTQVLEGCIGQPAINQAFANWANSFAAGGVTGSCDPVITYSVNGSGSFTQSELVDVILGSIPGACEGGSITVVCTASNGCETASCSSTLIVDPATAPAPLACPPPVDVDGCAGQDAINNAFATWLGSFSSNVTGGCDPVVTYSVNGVGAYSQSELSQVVNAPDACSGGSVVIVCTVEDVCGSQSCTSTFDVTPVPAIDVSCPPSQSLSGCVGQQFINIAFANWANSFSSNVTGGCSPVLEYFVNGDGPFSPTALLGVLSPPSSCTGGVVSVVCVVSDVCGTQTCESTFSVEAVSPLEIECPPSDVIEGCIGQAAVDAAFINWASSFGGNATGGCNPVITYSVNGSGSYTQSELVAAVAAVIPPACEGGSVVVVCTATNGCETQTCSSQLVVDATSSIPPLECPPSETLECVDQATINAAFLAWANSFGAGMSGTCAPVITYSVNGSGSFTQSELVGVIASSIPDVCTGGSIEVVCTATNECGGTSVCSSTLTVAPPQPLGNITCPDSEIHDGCIGQAAIDAAFESWYSGFGSNVTGGCNPVITYSVNGSGSFTQSELVDVLSSNPPSACDGGVVTVTCTASNGCTSVTCSSSFTVTPADVMTAEIECPANVDLDGCIGQTAIDAAFAAWSSAFTTTVTGGCVPVITYTLNGSGPLTPAELLDALVAPDACEGGTLVVVCTIEDVCGANSCTTVFNVTGAPSVTPLACPAPEPISCSDQATVNAAFAAWAAEFTTNVVGGCNPVLTYTVNGAGPFTPAELAGAIAAVVPDACTGGSVEVVCTLTDQCGTQTCTSVLTVLENVAPVLVSCPEDETIGCEAAVACLDFNNLSSGEVVNQIVQGSLVVDVTAYSQAGIQDAVIFNSNNPTADPDLGTPNIVFGGTGVNADDPDGYNESNNKSMGNLLIVQNPLANEPDDNMLSDSIVMTFSEPVYLISIVMVDIETPQAVSGAGAFMYDAGGVLVGFVPFIGGSDNNLEVVSLNTGNVSKLVVCFGSLIFQSGAIGEVCYANVDVELAAPIFEDDCDNFDVTVAETIVEGECTLTITREFFATDECGGVSETCLQTTTMYLDAVCPEIICPDDIVIPCGVPVPAPDPSSVTAIDNCAPPSDIFITHVEDIVEGVGCDEVIRRIYSATDTCGNTSLCVQFITRSVGVTVDASVYLQAAMNADSTGMDANINALLPLSHPYGVAPFLHPGSESVGAMPTNVVDWMMLELRDQNTQLVVESRAALLLTTGQIVDLDGVSPVGFASPPDFYYLAIRHRNHLDIISEVALDLTSGSGGCDFTSGCASSDGMLEIASPSAFAMYMGDINGDHQIRYNNAMNDKNLILQAVGLFTPNNILFSGYYFEDVNMDGEVRYNNADNDKNAILSVVGLFTPNEFIFGQLD